MGAELGVSAKSSSGKDVFFKVTEVKVPATVRNGVNKVTKAVGKAAKKTGGAAKDAAQSAAKGIQQQKEKADISIDAVLKVDLDKLHPDHKKQIVDKLKSMQHESMLPKAEGHKTVGAVSSSSDINHKLNQIGLVGFLPTGADLGVFVYYKESDKSLSGFAATITYTIGGK